MEHERTNTRAVRHEALRVLRSNLSLPQQRETTPEGEAEEGGGTKEGGKQEKGLGV